MTSTPARKSDLLSQLSAQGLLDAAADIDAEPTPRPDQRIMFAWLMAEFCDRIGHQLDRDRLVLDAQSRLRALDALRCQLPDAALATHDVTWPGDAPAALDLDADGVRLCPGDHITDEEGIEWRVRAKHLDGTLLVEREGCTQFVTARHCRVL